MKFHLCWKKAILLAVAALLILAPAAIAAESVEGENLKMESLKTSVKVGGTVTVSLGLNEVTADSVTGGIKFDTNLMECTAITGPNGEELSDFMVTGDVDKANPPHVFYKTYSSLDSDDVNTTGIVGFAYAGLVAAPYSEETVLKATFKAKATGEATFVLFEDTSYDYAAGSGYQNDASATAKTTITEGGGMTIKLTNRTSGADVKGQVDGIEDGGDYAEGDTFTVTCGEACVIIAKQGETLTRLTGEKVADGQYRFTLTDCEEIIIDKKGDVTLDGNLKNQDATQIKANALSKKSFNAEQLLTGDVDANGVIKNQDATKAKAAALGKKPLDWDEAASQ